MRRRRPEGGDGRGVLVVVVAQEEHAHFHGQRAGLAFGQKRPTDLAQAKRGVQAHGGAVQQGEFAVFLQGVRGQGAPGFVLLEEHLQALGQEVRHQLDVLDGELAARGLGRSHNHMSGGMPVG